ncbi:MOSC domain-containing protein [Jatrophihabitans sp.]|uniref:MOSC domain-containing protein n=1 Tax=Jatrophihabitans sp. TaxID=1932789 RepID=UPI002CBED8EE|nr:MOSC domain-containing protein [Jatrophihabitans sp.]
MTDQLGTVAMLARYPVKSMRGERLDRAELRPYGIAGDREWAVYTADGGIGSGKSSRRFRRVDGLLGYRATLDAAGSVPLIESPDGERWRADDPQAAEQLSARLGRPLRLDREGEIQHKDDSPLHLVSTASLRALGELLGEPVDVDRFRPNLLLEVAGTDFVEDGWTGRELRLGSGVVVRLGAGMPRCVMVDMAQGPLGPDGRILKVLASERNLLLGVKAEVVRPGTVRLGDPAVLA